MNITGGAKCGVCGKLRRYGDLIVVTSNVDDRVPSRYVCRPTVEGHDPMCFRRGTCASTHHRIAIATEPAGARVSARHDKREQRRRAIDALMTGQQLPQVSA
jgi:hypothetical protein